MLRYTGKGLRAPEEYEPKQPLHPLRSFGFIKFGDRPPYEKYEVFKDAAGLFWAEKKPTSIYPETDYVHRC